MIPRNLEGMPRCGARNKGNGAPCQQPARKGSSRCRKHGGNTPEALEVAERRVAFDATLVAANKYGTPRTISALDALEGELHRTQGHVDWLAEKIADNPDPGWLAVYQQERSHLATLSHRMITANVAERRTTMEEQALGRLETALHGALRELGYDPKDPRVRPFSGGICAWCRTTRVTTTRVTTNTTTP